MHTIHLERELGANAIVLAAEGEVDAYTEPELSEALAKVEDEGSVSLVADLTNVSFLDSTALSLLVHAVREVEDRGGSARVVLPETMARRIFEITTLDESLPVVGSREEALTELSDSEGPPTDRPR